MSRIERSAGVTVIESGPLLIKTNLINRHRYNGLRKLDTIYPDQVFSLISKALRTRA